MGVCSGRCVEARIWGMRVCRSLILVARSYPTPHLTEIQGARRVNLVWAFVHCGSRNSYMTYGYAKISRPLERAPRKSHYSYPGSAGRGKGVICQDTRSFSELVLRTRRETPSILGSELRTSITIRTSRTSIFAAQSHCQNLQNHQDPPAPRRQNL